MLSGGSGRYKGGITGIDGITWSTLEICFEAVPMFVP